MKIDSARFIELHALLFKEGLLHILTAERERGGSLAQAVYHPVARDNARLRVDMQSIADDARPARIAGESRYLPLNILAWSGVDMTHDWGVLVGLIPLLRAFLAMVIIVRWLVSENRMRRLFFAYIFTVVIFTYISGLVFYDYEVLVNPKLHGFGNALWWAWMNVTTVGAEIFPVTAVGKVFCVLLPSLGMMFFPIFTTYVLQEYTHKKGE